LHGWHERPEKRVSEWIESDTFLLQKINYIHNNPVKRGYVLKAEDWYWFSANTVCELSINDLPL